jgi:hypothetical protein
LLACWKTTGLPHFIFFCSGWSLSIMWRTRSLPSTSPNLRAIASMA